ATILAVELLKLPLAIWTASRQGLQKSFMLLVGLPLICVLTFQLVKDMAVYEMGVAMTPASQMLEKATVEETKIAKLNGELATILAVELLKLPLAIWTASRQGLQKSFMLLVGLPLICVLTFQLVKDMAVYEMGVAMTPASQMLEKATVEETKIAQLNGELTAIEAKRAEREHKLAELATKQAKAKAELEESLKRNDTARQDAISLTDYQK